MAAKARAARKRLALLKERHGIGRGLWEANRRVMPTGGVDMFPGLELKQQPRRFHKRAPALPPAATTLTPEGHKYIKHGQMERHILPSDTRNVRSSPFRTGVPIF